MINRKFLMHNYTSKIKELLNKKNKSFLLITGHGSSGSMPEKSYQGS